MVGSKLIIDVLCRCFYNQQLKEIVEEFLKVLEQSDELCVKLMESLIANMGNDVINILVECPDTTSRANVASLVSFLLKRLLIIEATYLNEWESYTSKNGLAFERPRALSTRFIGICILHFNDKVARNWNKFEHFFEMLHSYAVDDSGLL